MSVCGVAGRRRRSAVARVLLGIRNASLCFAVLMYHLVPYIRACIAGAAFFLRLRVLFNFRVVSAEILLEYVS